MLRAIVARMESQKLRSNRQADTLSTNRCSLSTDLVRIIYRCLKLYNNNNRFTALCPGLPG